MKISVVFVIYVVACVVSGVSAWCISSPFPRQQQINGVTTKLFAIRQQEKDSPVDTTTEKYGLEAGLLKSIQKDDGGESAKSLLKKYGIAYLATSIPLALMSFGICYVLVDSGVDVSALLSKMGIDSEAGEKVGTFAIAYAAHKAASPIRFPPTVLLTPVVAKLIGKEVNMDVDQNETE